MIIQRILKKILCDISSRIASELFHSDINCKEILLTFDDGPHPSWTPKLLDLLKNNNIRAVFFVVGKHVIKYPDIAKRIVDDGHVIANHTFNHIDVNHSSTNVFIDNYLQCEEAIKKISGSSGKLFFRPPRGLIGFRELLYFLRKRIPILLWTIDSNDPATITVNKIIEIVDISTNNKEVLLFHDDSSFVLDVLEKSIPAWKENLFSFVKLHQEM